MNSISILELFNQHQHDLRLVYCAVYGNSVGEEIWRKLMEDFSREDARAIVKSARQLFMDADDTASYTQDHVWDVIVRLVDDGYKTSEAYKDLVKGSVSVQAEVVVEGDEDAS